MSAITWIPPLHAGDKLTRPEFERRFDAMPNLKKAEPPEWIGEVAYSSASYDLHVKLPVYHRTGVREYLVWRTYDRAIDWFVFREGEVERLTPGPDGIFRSEVMPGLWLDPEALLADNLAQVFRVAQQGVASPEHAAFVTRLQHAAAISRATP